MNTKKHQLQSLIRKNEQEVYYNHALAELVHKLVRP